MKILLTGAFGRLGSMVGEVALARGHALVCHDLDTPASRRLAVGLAGRATVHFGDLSTDTVDLGQLLDGVDGVIHTAALLPPQTELHAELAERVNVGVTRRLVEAIGAMTEPPRLVFPSTLSVFAITDDRPRPRTIHDPVEATDNYTRHKLEVEALLQESDIPWCLLRVGVSVDARTLSTDRATFRSLLQTRADNPVHWVHPRDVALAMVRALEVEEAHGQTLLIGGDATCQVTQSTFLGTAARVLGLTWPDEAHGDDVYYTHWMDTSASQALLQFQQHPFAVYEQEMAAALRRAQPLVRPLRPLLNRALAPMLRRV